METYVFNVMPDYTHNDFLAKAKRKPNKFCNEWRAHMHRMALEEWRIFLDSHNLKESNAESVEWPNPLKDIKVFIDRFLPKHTVALPEVTEPDSYSNEIDEITEPNEQIRNLYEVVLKCTSTPITISNKADYKKTRPIHVRSDYCHQLNTLVIVRPDVARKLEDWEPSAESWPWLAEILEINNTKRCLLIHWYGFNVYDEPNEHGRYWKLCSDPLNASEQENLEKELGCKKRTKVNDFCQWVDMDQIMDVNITLNSSLYGHSGRNIPKMTFKKWKKFMEMDLGIVVENDLYIFK